MSQQLDLLCRDQRPQGFVEGTSFQQVPYPQHGFQGIQRFTDEVLGAQRQGAQASVAGGVGGEHEDRQVFAVRDASVELFEYRKAIELRHVQVENDQVRLEAVEQVQGSQRLGAAQHVGQPLAHQQLFHQIEIGPLVVDDQNAQVGVHTGSGKYWSRWARNEGT